MIKEITDKTVCRQCRKREPEIQIRQVKGKPMGICNDCRNTSEVLNRRKHAMGRDFHKQQQSIFSVNYRTLAIADFKAFPLKHRKDDSVEGYLVNLRNRIFVSINNGQYCFKTDLYGIASWLGNQNLIIDSKAIQLKTPEGEPVKLDEIGQDMPLQDVTEFLVMFNKKLREYAVNKVKKEMNSVKALFQK